MINAFHSYYTQCHAEIIVHIKLSLWRLAPSIIRMQFNVQDKLIFKVNILQYKTVHKVSNRMNKHKPIHSEGCSVVFVTANRHPKNQCHTLSWLWDRALQWRHSERNDVSNHQLHYCLLNRLFRRRSRKTSKLRVTGLCEWDSPLTGEFPAQMASYAENDSIWWRHHGIRSTDV